MRDITQLLHQIDEGDPNAADRLLPLVYDELRKLAAAKMASERVDHTLQATALVHEAYVRLVGHDASRQWNGRSHFFVTAAEAMRRVLIQEARRRKAEKRGGNRQRADIDPQQLAAEERSQRLLEIDEVLDRLGSTDPEKAQLVKLRYFVGMTVAEAAEALEVSVATAERQWAYVRSWLQCELAMNRSS